MYKFLRVLKCVVVYYMIFVYLLSIFNLYVFAEATPGKEYNVWYDIPSNLGGVYAYMGWHTITATSSNQYKLREMAGENYNDEGYAIIDDCFVIAVTQREHGGIGTTGDYIDFELTSGEILNCVVGDLKNPNDAGCTVWGHYGGQGVVEFVVNRSWYTSDGKNVSHPNPSEGNGQMDELLRGQRVVKYICKGNYLNGDRFGASSASKSKSSGVGKVGDFFTGMVTFIDGVWNSLSTMFENHMIRREDVTVRWDMTDKDDEEQVDFGGLGGISNNEDLDDKYNYFQGVGEHSNWSYGGGVMASHGCGLAALAIALSCLKREEIKISDIYQWGLNYQEGGLRPTQFKAACEKWGLNYDSARS